MSKITVTGQLTLTGGQLTAKETVVSLPAGYTLWAWGEGENGQLGQEDTADRSSPVQIAGTYWTGKIRKDVANSGSHVIKTDGSLWAWGTGGNGIIGDGTDIKRSSPVQVGDLTDWAKVGAGGYWTMMIKNNGSLWVWGKNDLGQLGLGDAGATNRSSPVQLGSLTNWFSSIGGNAHSHAIKIDGTLWAWGANNWGQLGLGNIVYRSSPVQVGVLSDWAIVDSGKEHNLALKTDGTLWSWGRNEDGVLGLGIGASIHKSSPVQIGSLSDWASIGAARNRFFAIKTNGSLWAWGKNVTYGGLGLGHKTNKNSPVQVGSLTDWSTVLGGRNTTLAVKTDGTLWSWGSGKDGRLGHGNTTNRSSPVQIGTDTTWIDIGSGGSHFLALKAL